MTIEVSEEAANLEDYARIRMSFEVSRVLDVTALENGLGGFAMSERKLQVPYLRDYDAIESPLQWPRSFDMSNWGFFAARSDGLRVGGAAVAFNTSGLTMLEDRRDIGGLMGHSSRYGAKAAGSLLKDSLSRHVKHSRHFKRHSYTRVVFQVRCFL